MMASELATTIAEIVQLAPSLHTAGTFSSGTLQAIYRYASKLRITHSAETGSGASTLLFSHLSRHHTVFAVDEGTDSINAVKRSSLLRPGIVTFVEGPSQLTLPRHRFEHKLQVALIDGPHAYPFPDLEYYHFYPHLDVGALLIVDDIHIRSINNLFEFLTEDEMFHLEEVVETTAIFTRTEAPTFSPVGDGWWTQAYNRRDFEATPAEPGESDALVRVRETAPFYIDELGPIKQPNWRNALEVPASESLLVAGWALDERNQRPASWVEMVLDGRPFRTGVRVPRGDVATSFGSIRYLRCGFRAALPAGSISSGRHRLAVRVGLQGGQTYYEAPEISFEAR